MAEKGTRLRRIGSEDCFWGSIDDGLLTTLIGVSNFLSLSCETILIDVSSASINGLIIILFFSFLMLIILLDVLE